MKLKNKSVTPTELALEMCNELADLRPLFLQIKDGEKLKDACLHLLGDAYQIQVAVAEVESKYEVKIELLFIFGKHGRVSYIPFVQNYDDFYYYSEGVWECESYNSFRKKAHELTENFFIGFNDKITAYKEAINFIESNLQPI